MRILKKITEGKVLKKNYRFSKKGLTLIELIVVIIMVGILMSGLSLGIKETIDLWRFLTFRNEIASQGRIALVRMAREIRQIKTRSPSNEPIIIANEGRLQFTDIDDLVIGYQLSGNSLMRNSDILADNASNLTFCYYDRDKNEICSPACSCDVPGGQLSDVEIIGVRLEVQSGGQSMTLRSQVYPRNLGY